MRHLTGAVVVGDRENAAGAVLAVNVRRGDGSDLILQVLLLEGEHGAVRLRHDPPVEPEDEPGYHEPDYRVRAHDSIQRHATTLQRDELKRLRKPSRQEDCSEEERQRRHQADDLGDQARIVGQEYVTRGCAPIVKIIHVLRVVDHNEEDDQDANERGIGRQEAPYDVPVESLHAVGKYSIMTLLTHTQEGV